MLKKTTKIAAIFTAAVMALSLCACGTSASSSGSASTTSSTTNNTVNADAAQVGDGFYLDYENKYDPSKPIYVIGHLSPDTDTVCSAIAFAQFLNQMGYDAKAAIAGEPNAETSYVLEKYGVEVPEILTEATGKQFVLVDHSEYAQSLPGMDSAVILGIFDHHSVGDVKTSDPIMYVGLPVGSTSTIVYKMYKDYGMDVPENMAGLMLSAILSDTKGLRSSTATSYDTKTVSSLASIVGVDDTLAYTVAMMNAANILDTLTTQEIVKYDYKEYTAGSTKFAVAVVQSADGDQLARIAGDVDTYMKENLKSLGVDQCYVMLTNQITMETELLCYGNGALEAAQKAFDTKESKIVLPDTSSRKKQVVPPLTEVLEAS